MKINITSKIEQNITQKFVFYTEELWQKEKKLFSPKTDMFFSAIKNEVFVITQENQVDFLIGLGNNPSNSTIQSIVSKFSFDFRKKISATPTLLVHHTLSEEQVEEIIKGLFLGTYEYPFQEKHVFYDNHFQLLIHEISEQTIQQIQQNTKALCLGQFTSMEWLNKPANYKKTNQVVAFIKEISEKYQFKTTIFNRNQAQELGLGAFLAVNQASSNDCAFTLIEYQSKNPNAKTIGLVGKCVLFDTGGISIKPSDNMHYMKSDMGGATAVIGTLIATAEQQLPINIIAILPITDNAVSANAYLPSDVVTAYNGKTIEVLNTDAEGRMTLADGLSYLVHHYKTDVIIDLATLTGSSVRMFGNTCAALFSNNNELINNLLKSGDQTNQKLWNMPLWDVWKDDFTSDVADFKNISLKPVGDCIVAAKFLEQFIYNHDAWAHLDIAGVAFGNTIYAKEKAATGYGVQLLINFFKNFL